MWRLISTNGSPNCLGCAREPDRTGPNRPVLGGSHQDWSDSRFLKFGTGIGLVPYSRCGPTHLEIRVLSLDWQTLALLLQTSRLLLRTHLFMPHGSRHPPFKFSCLLSLTSHDAHDHLLLITHSRGGSLAHDSQRRRSRPNMRPLSLVALARDSTQQHPLSSDPLARDQVWIDRL